jgi:cardiolipin synthase
MTIPNLLTTSRIVLTPVIGYAIVAHHYEAATGMFVYAALTDMVRHVRLALM